jgi:hypothetical protein
MERAIAMSDLYEDDILLWSERQADALRRRAANESTGTTLPPAGPEPVRAVHAAEDRLGQPLC